MVRVNDNDDPDERRRVSRAPDVVRDGWVRTIRDVRAMARDREATGYDTLQLFADDTTPEAPGDGSTEQWGLTYLVADDAADSFREFDERTAFDETAVYQTWAQGNVFIATECVDFDAKAVLFVAGIYRVRRARDLVRVATDRDRMWTRIRKLDSTVIGSIEHDDASSFFPDPERFYAHESDSFHVTDG